LLLRVKKNGQGCDKHQRNDHQTPLHVDAPWLRC
jgi:hypothetical protein